MTTTVFVYTMRGRGGSWSRYSFPVDVDNFAQLGNTLYLRHGSKVSRVDEFYTADVVNGGTVEIPGIVQWPWLDFGQPTVTKMLESFDIVASGTTPSISFGYSQNNPATFTTPFAYGALDSTEGTPIPMPISAPSFSAKVTFAAAPWSLSALTLHLHDQQPAS